MNIDIIFYWKLFVRRLPIMVIFLLLCSTLGVITALKMPETWSSSARLLVEGPQIPDEMVRSTIQTDAIEQLDILQQRMLTRANLIDIANRRQVFENIRQMEPDTVEEEMRSAVNVRRTAGRNQATLLSISFEARSGEIAATVVNDFVTIILEENSSFRISRAEGTLQFFEQEVQRLEEELAEKSSAISIFKTENVGALPENQSYRLGRQNLLQERLERLEREKSTLLAQREDLLELWETSGGFSNREMAPLTEEQRRLREVQTALDDALTVYSDQHPRVVRLQALLDRLSGTDSNPSSGAQDGDAPGTEGAPTTSPEQAILNANLAEIDTRIEFMDQELASTTLELQQIEDAINKSSSNAITLNALEREYAMIEQRYNGAVNNLNSARMTERIETTAQGQRITVIENAVVPAVPNGPNRPKIAAAGAAAGLGLAGGYFVLLELLNRSIRRPAELTSRFNVVPITTIPYMESRRRRVLRRGGLIFATLFVLVTVPAVLWYIDTNYLPLDILVQKGLTRFGLG